MQDTLTHDFERLMADLAAGSEEAAWEIAEVYTPYIIRAVRASLPHKIRRRLDSQDFAQAIWASILVKREDLYRFKSPAELVAYLAGAAKHKVIDASRRHLGTLRRDINREQSLDELHSQETSERGGRRIERAFSSRDPSPSQFAMLRERWNQILSDASERDRRVLELRLRARSNAEIAESLDVSEATVRRTVSRLVNELAK